MTIMDMLSAVKESAGTIVSWGGSGLLILLTLIEITPQKINPWKPLSWVAKKIGNAINAELLAEVKDLRAEVKKIKDNEDERNAISCRSRILRFGDEILLGVEHSKEHFDQILDDIKTYNNYCDTHPEFENNKTVITTQVILETYHRLFVEHKFKVMQQKENGECPHQEERD